MLRFLYAIITNTKRGPHILRTMRKMINHKDKYSIKTRYAYALRLIRYLKIRSYYYRGLWYREFT